VYPATEHKYITKTFFTYQEPAPCCDVL